MAYADIFKKVTYVNKDSADFEEGVSPSISAEQLNAQQVGIEGALAAADTIAADVDVCEDNIEMLDERTSGVFCEICNEDVQLPPSAWVNDEQAQCLKATLKHDLIRSDTDVDLTLTNAQKGVYAIDAMDPEDGQVVLYTTAAIPDETLLFRISIKEVRAVGTT